MIDETDDYKIIELTKDNLIFEDNYSYINSSTPSNSTHKETKTYVRQ